MKFRLIYTIIIAFFISSSAFSQGKTYFETGTVAFDSVYRTAYYSNGLRAFNPSYNAVFYKNKKRAYHKNYKNVYYSNGEIAYNNSNRNVYYENGMKAFDYRTKMLFSDKGESKGKLNKIGGSEFVVESKKLKVKVQKVSGKSVFELNEQDENFVYITDFKTYFKIGKGSAKKNTVVNSIKIK